MSFEPVRVASMGLGRWANVLADAALRGGKIQIVSCFSRTAEKRRDFLQAHRLSVARDHSFHVQRQDGAISTGFGLG